MKEIIKFVKKHDFPEENIETIIKSLSSNQLKFEEFIFSRKTGGNAVSPKEQYQNAENCARFWDNFRNSDKTVLDVGCGQGYFLFFMNDVYNIETHGLNLSVIECELARHCKPDKEKIMKYNKNINRIVKLGSAQKMPFPDESYDGIGCYGVLMMTPCVEKIFKGDRRPIDVCKEIFSEFYRVLKPEGKLHLITLSKSIGANKSNPEKTEDYIAFDENGFEVYDAKGKVIDYGNNTLESLLQNAGFKKSIIQEKGYLFCSAEK